MDYKTQANGPSSAVSFRRVKLVALKKRGKAQKCQFLDTAQERELVIVDTMKCPSFALTKKLYDPAMAACLSPIPAMALRWSPVPIFLLEKKRRGGRWKICRVEGPRGRST